MIAKNLTLDLIKPSTILIKSNENYRKLLLHKSDTASTKLLPTVGYAIYLGVRFDNRLSFGIHINNLVKSCKDQLKLWHEQNHFAKSILCNFSSATVALAS